MAKRISVPISVARAELFQLADLVRSSSEHGGVILGQRGAADRVVLVREARLAYLESRVSDLDKRDRPPFTLAGALYGIPERADRLVAATAAALDSPLISNDPEVRRVPHVATIW